MSVALRVALCRVGFEWFLTAHIWYSGLFVVMTDRRDAMERNRSTHFARVCMILLGEKTEDADGSMCFAQRMTH